MYIYGISWKYSTMEFRDATTLLQRNPFACDQLSNSFTCSWRDTGSQMGEEDFWGEKEMGNAVKGAWSNNRAGYDVINPVFHTGCRPCMPSWCSYTKHSEQTTRLSEENPLQKKRWQVVKKSVTLETYVCEGKQRSSRKSTQDNQNRESIWGETLQKKQNLFLLQTPK